MKKTIGILGIIFISFLLVSCENSNISTGNENVNNYGETSEESDENILESNTQVEMSEYQKTGLQEGDIAAVMKTTNGTITLKLFYDKVPKTVTNFIGLAQSDYYNDVTFHRVIKGFMIQGGDPDGTGMGGQSIYGDSFEDEFDSELGNFKYSISMANSGPNTNGSQFFINEANNNFLDNKHSVFGQVVEGEQNVDKIAKVKTGAQDKPEKDVKIIDIKIQKYNGTKLEDFTFDVEAAKKSIEEIEKKELEAKKDKEIENGDVVSVHYTGKLEDGEKFDSSLDRGEPIVFEVGEGKMIKGFDSGVVGMKIGEKKTLTLSPEQAYGEYNPENVQVVDKENLKDFEDNGIKLEKGSELPTAQGVFSIIDSDDKTVTIDINHKLAGKTLVFDIEIIDIN